MNRTNTLAATTNNILSVSQLNRETRLLLSDHFLTVQVEGEISNLSSPSSGHIYFSLKDNTAQIRCAMFRSYRRSLNFKPENGNQVIVTAQVGLYEARGDYQLIVEAMQEEGDGALRRAFEALKFKLSNEGLFAEQHKQSLPKIPKTLGVITSPTGAAIRDILSVTKRRFPALPIIIYPVAVQGDHARFEVAKAIQSANQRQECDVLMLARGGGSLEDLWAFNEEIVARAIFASRIPLITGIGHEIDFSIADFVADLRAPTPSAAAEHITPDQVEWLTRLKRLEEKLKQRARLNLLEQQKKLAWLDIRLQQLHPGKQLQAQAQRLDELETRLTSSMQRHLHRLSIRNETLSAKLWQHHPASKIKIYHLQRQYLSQRLITAQQHRLEQYQQRLLKTSQTLHAVSPLATLNRGYAILTDNESDQVIRTSKDLQTGQRVNTQLAQGQIVSRVEEIRHAK